MKATKEQLEARLTAAHKQNDRAWKKAAAANKECDALRREIRTMRAANFILQKNLENTRSDHFRVRYEKVIETLQMIREIARVEANGVPDAAPTTLEPWLGPWWDRNRRPAVSTSTDVTET